MHWGQIKTLLILSFLILDVYLFVQFMEKKAEADIGILEQQTSSIEEQLADDKITYQKLPEQEYEETFISVKQKVFTEEDLKAQRKSIAQDSYILNNTFIASKVEDKVQIKETATTEQITEIFHNLVYFDEEYVFWNWNKEENVLIFFQNKLERPVYYNQNGLVLLYLNEKNEVSFYTQTMLGDAEPLAEKRKLMKPMQAVETLYRANELHPGDHIDNVKIGFHTRVPFESGVQVFVPIWRVKVNEEKHYFINAIEGFTFSTEEGEFLTEVIASSIEKLQLQRGKDTVIESMYVELKEREIKLSG